MEIAIPTKTLHQSTYVPATPQTSLSPQTFNFPQTSSTFFPPNSTIQQQPLATNYTYDHSTNQFITHMSLARSTYHADAVKSSGVPTIAQSHVITVTAPTPPLVSHSQVLEQPHNLWSLPERSNLIAAINDTLNKSPKREALLASPAKKSMIGKTDITDLMSKSETPEKALELWEEIQIIKNEDGSVYEGWIVNGKKRWQGQINNKRRHKLRR
jgi:hypothetical protein